MSEIEAARLVRAALELIRDALPEGSDAHHVIRVQAVEWSGRVAKLEPDAPPWVSETYPSKSLPWSAVLCGDSVQAPNGQWYHVDSWSRTGEQVAAMIKGPDGKLIRTTPAASAVVPVRRGPAGQAADIFAAGGLELIPIS